MIFLTLLVINLLLILILHNLAFKLNLIDFNQKIHQGEIPLVGGIAIYATIIIGVLLTKTLMRLIYSFTSAIVVIIGILDDIINIDFKIRFFCNFASLIFC